MLTHCRDLGSVTERPASCWRSTLGAETQNGQATCGILTRYPTINALNVEAGVTVRHFRNVTRQARWHFVTQTALSTHHPRILQKYGRLVACSCDLHVVYIQ